MGYNKVKNFLGDSLPPLDLNDIYELKSFFIFYPLFLQRGSTETKVSISMGSCDDTV